MVLGVSLRLLPPTMDKRGLKIKYGCEFQKSRAAA
jgi:hypothetical protein